MDNKIIHEKQDFAHLNWAQARNSSGTAGSFLKAYSTAKSKKIYYKLSNYDVIKGIAGHECINEIIADRLLNILGIEHLSYKLIHADIKVNGKTTETYLCESDDFKKPDEDKTALDTFFEIERNENESPMDFCRRMGWEDYIYEMLLVDFLILNRDRHGANIEVLRDKKAKTVRLPPLFDHGFSLLSRCDDMNAVKKYDVMDDKPVQCFAASHSAKDNLMLIPPNNIPQINRLKKSDKKSFLTD